MKTIEEVKLEHFERRAQFRESLFAQPVLHNQFLELTLRCNLRCEHCGSRCGDVVSDELSLETYRDFLGKIKRDFGTRGLMLCITGGEPLLRKDFFDIMACARDLGFAWGMTSNATLIDREAARRLYETGMKTISVSIDGLPETHDALRGVRGAYDRAMRGIDALLEQGGFGEVQVTTVVTHRSIQELDKIYEIMKSIDIDSWRLTGIEPIGRALEHPEQMLTPNDHRQLLRFIKEERLKGMPLSYGCCHFLGTEFEREVRDWYFLCGAGRCVASVTAGGDIRACLDIERTPETLQGNILRDDFTEVWRSGFRTFRRSLAEESATCRACPLRRLCDRGSRHSWDEARGEQRVCMRGILFE